MRLLINGEVLSVAGTISAYRINTLTNNMFDTSTMYLVTLDTAESSDNESDGNVRRPIQRVVWQDDEGNFTVDGRDSSTYEVRGVERSPVTLTSSPRRSSTGGSALFESTANSSTNRADLGLGTSYQVPRPIGVRPPGVSQQQPEQRRKVINKAVTVISYTSAGYRDENMVILTLDENECSLENFCMKVKSINNWEEDTILILDRSQTPISESPATSGPDFWRTPRKLFAVRDEDYKKFIYKEKAPKRKSELQNVENDLKIIKQHIGEMRGLQGVFSRPRDPLTCMVCLERASFPLYACFKCNKIIGCYVCSIRLHACPNCRGAIPENAAYLRGLEQAMLGSEYNTSSDREIAVAVQQRPTSAGVDQFSSDEQPEIPDDDDDDDFLPEVTYHTGPRRSQQN